MCRFRRLWRGVLAARPRVFPWLQVAGRELTGTTVIDLDASVVLATSDTNENAKPTDKGGVGFVPNLATCDNVDDVLVIDPAGLATPRPMMPRTTSPPRPPRSR